MSLEEGESEKCYRFLDGGVHGSHGPAMGHYRLWVLPIDAIFVFTSARSCTPLCLRTVSRLVARA